MKVKITLRSICRSAGNGFRNIASVGVQPIDKSKSRASEVKID